MNFKHLFLGATSLGLLSSSLVANAGQAPITIVPVTEDGIDRTKPITRIGYQDHEPYYDAVDITDFGEENPYLPNPTALNQYGFETFAERPFVNDSNFAIQGFSLTNPDGIQTWKDTADANGINYNEEIATVNGRQVHRLQITGMDGRYFSTKCEAETAAQYNGARLFELNLITDDALVVRVGRNGDLPNYFTASCLGGM